MNFVHFGTIQKVTFYALNRVSPTVYNIIAINIIKQHMENFGEKKFVTIILY